jgi:hypothetical protein
MTAYDDYSLSNWIEEHPADLFHLIQSNVQWSFYFTKSVEYAIFCFAIWRSRRVCNNKLREELTKIEDDAASDRKVIETQISINTNIHHIRLTFYTQLFYFGSFFFASTPGAVFICKNMVQESNQ